MASAARAAIAAAANAFRTLAFDRQMAAGLFAALALLPFLSPILGGSYLLLVAERVLIFAIAAISLELLIGAGGLVSFGHAAFLGIGAYAAGIAASHGLGTLHFALPAALGASALFALLTGAVAVRTRGVYFIMITLAFGQMAFFVAGSLAPYGGDDGLSWPGRTDVFGTRVLENRIVFFYVALALAAGSWLLVGRLVASRFGRVLRGLTDSETRMQAIGFAPYRFHLAAYVIAGTLCGLAGFLLGNQAEFTSPAYMHWQRSGELIVMVLLGGTGTLYGPLLGALALVALEETLPRLTEHWKAILGPLLVLVVLFARGGIAGAIEAWRRSNTTPTELWDLLVARMRAALARAEHRAAGAIAATLRLGRATEIGAGLLRQRGAAALRPTLHAVAAFARRSADRATAASRQLWAALARLAAHLTERLAATSARFAESIRRGAGGAASRSKPWRAALRRRLHALAGSTERAIAAARARWGRR
jgi:branched-chain amino acid transport system permease protein